MLETECMVICSTVSSVIMDVVLEMNGVEVDVGAWFRKKNYTSHINIGE